MNEVTRTAGREVGGVWIFSLLFPFSLRLPVPSASPQHQRREEEEAGQRFSWILA